MDSSQCAPDKGTVHIRRASSIGSGFLTTKSPNYVPESICASRHFLRPTSSFHDHRTYSTSVSPHRQLIMDGEIHDYYSWIKRISIQPSRKFMNCLCPNIDTERAVRDALIAIWPTTNNNPKLRWYGLGPTMLHGNDLIKMYRRVCSSLLQ